MVFLERSRTSISSNSAGAGYVLVKPGTEAGPVRCSACPCCVVVISGDGGSVGGIVDVGVVGLDLLSSSAISPGSDTRARCAGFSATASDAVDYNYKLVLRNGLRMQ